jgi:hypothetical protein
MVRVAVKPRFTLAPEYVDVNVVKFESTTEPKLTLPFMVSDGEDVKVTAPSNELSESVIWLVMPLKVRTAVDPE